MNLKLFEDLDRSPRPGIAGTSTGDARMKALD
jgi:hypothetical protein